MKRAIKIEENFYDFLENHPEIILEKDSKGFLYIKFPEEAEQTSYTIYYGKVIHLVYKYKNEIIHFPWKPPY